MNEHTRFMKMRAIAVLGALAMLIGACSSAGDTVAVDSDTADTSATPDDAEAPDDETDNGEPDNDEPDNDETDEPADDSQTEAADDEPADDDVEEAAAETTGEVIDLETQFESLTGGRYRLAGLGAEMEVDVLDGWWVQPNDESHIVLTHPSSNGPGDKDIVFVRTSGLIDIDAAGNPDLFEGDTLANSTQPASTFDDWVASLGDDVLAGPTESTEVGGRDATVVPIRLDENTGCIDEMFGCLHILDSAGTFTMFVDRGNLYHLYWIPLDEHVPMAILVAAGDADVDTFFPEAEALIASLTWGEVGPHQLGAGDGERVEAAWELGLPTDVPAGDIMLPTFGGVTLTLDRDLFIFQTEGYASLNDPDSGPMSVEFQEAVWNTEGTRLITVDDVLETLSDSNPAEQAATTVGGVDARVFDIDPARDGELTFHTSEATVGTEDGWRTPVLGRIWVMELADGAAIISAESFAGEGSLEDAITMANAILPTMSFAE